MKTKNLFFLAILLFGTMLFSSCGKNNDDENTHNNSENPKFYALDISAETDWDYVVAADNEENSTIWFYINRATNIPTTMFFKPFSNQDYGFVVKFKSNGLPDYTVFGDTIVVFENFRDTKCDIAVIYPNISVKYFYNVETGVNWNNIDAQVFNSPMLRAGNSETLIAFQHGMKFIGSALGVVAAVTGVAAAITVGAPVGIALAVVAAGITAVNIYNSYSANNFAFGMSTNVGGKVMTMIGCANITNVNSQISCFSGLASFVSSLTSDMRMQAFVNTLNQGLVTPVWKLDYAEPINNGFPILIWQSNKPSGIEEIRANNNLTLYPNPAKDYIFIQSEQPIERAEIYNQSGVCVLKNNNPTEILDVSDFPNGFYLVRIYVNGIPANKKIIVRK